MDKILTVKVNSSKDSTQQKAVEMSTWKIKLALDPNSAEFIAWLSKDIMIFIFFIIFIITWYYGKYEYNRHDHKIFQRLRAIVICITIADFIWPFQYYFDFSLIARIALLTLSSMVDLLTGIAIGILSYRIFNTYFHTKQFKSPRVSNIPKIPCYINLIMIIYLAGYLIAVAIEIFSFSYDNTDINEKEDINVEEMYLIALGPWFAINSIYTILLISFLIQVISLFKSINNRQSNLLRDGQCTLEEATYLYSKMILLCLGFILYYLNLLGAYLYLFIFWDFDIVLQPLWIIDHEIIGHLILYLTFYSYLRVRNNTTNANEQLNVEYADTDDLVDDNKNIEKKENENNILNITYQNLYSDLGKLCNQSYNKPKNAMEPPPILKLKSTLSDNISINSSFSNTTDSHE